MSYKLAVFDLDGTILDTLEDLCDSVNFALDTKGMPYRTLEEVRTFVGNGIYKLILRSVPSKTSESDINEVFEAFKEHYTANCYIKTKAYDGIAELLNELVACGVKVAVLSNKAHEAVTELCRKYFDGNCFTVCYGERQGIPRKPAPDSLLSIIDELGVTKSDTIYIGDSEVDVKTSLNAEVDAVFVSWGFRDKQILLDNGAKIIVDTPSELKKYILK